MDRVWFNWCRRTVVDWVRERETGTVQWTNDPASLYISVMRQPIQYFARLETALEYARNSTESLFRYRLHAPVQLLDLDDRVTLQHLQKRIFQIHCLIFRRDSRPTLSSAIRWTI